MIANEPAVTVQEVSMQEWAMLAFHAAGRRNAFE